MCVWVCILYTLIPKPCFARSRRCVGISPTHCPAVIAKYSRWNLLCDIFLLFLHHNNTSRIFVIFVESLRLCAQEHSVFLFALFDFSRHRTFLLCFARARGASAPREIFRYRNIFLLSCFFILPEYQTVTRYINKDRDPLGFLSFVLCSLYGVLNKGSSNAVTHKLQQ